MVPFLLFGQMIDNFDSAPEDSTYWVWETSENAVPDSGYINMSFVTDQVSEGAGAMQLEYSAHNIEAWGGYTKIYHMGSSAGDQEPGSIVAGTWKLSPEEGALKVGPGVNDGSWWQNSLEDVTTRACLFDDQFVFGSDGSFSNVMGTETWVETWQGVAAEGCATPVAPHDGSNAATYSYDAGAGTVTLTGVGAHIGLPKVYNGGELNASNADSSIESITYDIALSGADSDTMTVSIHQGGGYWTFKLVADDSELALAESWDQIFDWDATFDNGTALFSMLPDEGEVWDWSSYDSISFSYYNSIPQSLADRINLRLNLSDYGSIADPASYTGLGEYYYLFPLYS